MSDLGGVDSRLDARLLIAVIRAGGRVGELRGGRLRDSLEWAWATLGNRDDLVGLVGWMPVPGSDVTPLTFRDLLRDAVRSIERRLPGYAGRLNAADTAWEKTLRSHVDTWLAHKDQGADGADVQVSVKPAPEVIVKARGWELSWFVGSDELWLVGHDARFHWRLTAVDAMTVAIWMTWITRALTGGQVLLGVFCWSDLEDERIDTVIRLIAPGNDPAGCVRELASLSDDPPAADTPALGWPDSAPDTWSGTLDWLAPGGSLGRIALRITTQQGGGPATWSSPDPSERRT